MYTNKPKRSHKEM